jgi:phenylacetate-CoA ligase
LTIRDLGAIGWGLLGSLRRSRWPADAIVDYQSQALVRIMRHAVARVPFYRQLGIAPEEIRSAADLLLFPVVSKATIQEHQDEFLADGLDRAKLESSVTSGSTGQPTTTYFDRQSWLHGKYTLKIVRMVQNGSGFFSRVMIASEYSPEVVNAGSAGSLPGDRLFFRQRRISVHEAPARHVAAFAAFRPHALYAFPSYISELIAYCEEHSIALPRIPVVFTSSEVLSDGLRQRIARYFGARVCDIYGSTELKEVAWQCTEGRHHVNFDNVFVEHVRDERLGQDLLLLSTLTNRAMPLLRYRIGDIGRVNAGACPCGRQSPFITAISGREVDLLVLPSGRRVSPYVLITHRIDRTPEIRRYQFVQTSPDSLEIQVTLGPGSAGVDRLQPIADEVADRLGGEMRVTMIDVEQIPRTAGGKHRLLIRSAAGLV